MPKKPSLYSASPDVLASIQRGREQIARGETITFAEAARRPKKVVAGGKRAKAKAARNPHIGTSLDAFLKEEGLYEDVLARAAAKKRARRLAPKSRA